MSVLDLIQSGQAFTNPLAGPINTVKFAVNNVLTHASFSQLDPFQQMNMTTAVQNLDSQLQQFLTHTNQMSGVDLSGPRNFLSMSQIATSARTALGSDSCDSLNNVFGAITQALQFANAFFQLVTLIQTYLENPQLLADQVIQSINFQVQEITTQIQRDVAAFTQTQIVALQNALAQGITGLVGDPCVGAVFSQIATDQMRGVVNQKVSEQTSKLSSLQIPTSFS